MSSWRQWNMGSDVSSSAKMQPIAQMSGGKKDQVRSVQLWAQLAAALAPMWGRQQRSHRWLWCSAEPRAEARVLCTRKWPPQGQDRLKASAVNWRGGRNPYQLQTEIVGDKIFNQVNKKDTFLKKDNAILPIFTLPLSGPSPITKMFAGFCRKRTDALSEDFFPQIKQNYNQLTSTSVETRWAFEQNPKSAEERQPFSAAL